MPSRTSLGLKISHTTTITDSSGCLIYSCRPNIPRLMRGYEAHRIAWCTKYRDRYSPVSYRNGRYTLSSLLFHVISKYIWR